MYITILADRDKYIDKFVHSEICLSSYIYPWGTPLRQNHSSLLHGADMHTTAIQTQNHTVYIHTK